MKNSRLFYVVASLVALSMLFSSCSPAPAATPMIQTVVVTEQVPVVVTPTPEPTTAAEPVEGEITFAVVRGAMLDFMTPMAEKFMSEHPGTTVNIVEEPEGGAFEALIAAGNQPDIIAGSFGYMPAKYAAMDALVPLENMPGAEELFAELDPITVQ